MIDIRIRDSRDVRGPQCGNVRLDNGEYRHVPPLNIMVWRNERWAEYFDARLRGAFTTMGELP